MSPNVCKVSAKPPPAFIWTAKRHRKKSILRHLRSLIDALYRFLGRPPESQFAAYDGELPGCGLRHLTSDGAKRFVHRQTGSNGARHHFDRVGELPKQLIGEATALPSKQTPHHHDGHKDSRERHVEEGKSQQAIGIKDRRRRDGAGKQHILGAPIVSYPGLVIGQAMEKQPPGLDRRPTNGGHALRL